MHFWRIIAGCLAVIQSAGCTFVRESGARFRVEVCSPAVGCTILSTQFTCNELCKRYGELFCNLCRPRGGQHLIADIEKGLPSRATSYYSARVSSVELMDWLAGCLIQ